MVTGIVKLPPLSFPMIVNVVVMVDIKALFGTNLNLLPTTTWEAAVTASPAKLGTVALVELILFVSVTNNVPAFLLPNIAVYPSVVLYVGLVLGEIMNSLVFNLSVVILVCAIEITGIAVTPDGNVTNLYFITCVSSLNGSNIGVFLIEIS